jgi:MoxR-like ATPase
MAPPTARDIVAVSNCDGEVWVQHQDPVTFEAAEDRLAALPSTTLRRVPKHLGLDMPHGATLDEITAAVEGFVLRGETVTAVLRGAKVAEPAGDSAVSDLTALVAAQAAQTTALLELVGTLVKGQQEPSRGAVAGRTHEAYGDVLAIVGCGENAFLTGPAGTGKSHLAHSVAQGLGLDFYSLSCGPETSQIELVGFMNAHGDYVRTGFRDAFQHGGLFLIDEIDATDAGVVTALNAALANGFYAFPDGMVAKHKDFVCVAAANTWGTGPDAEYIGRNALDVASLDRFTALPVGYDESLEADIVAGFDCAPSVLAAVHQMRRNATTHRIRLVVSTRGLLGVARLVEGGMPLARALSLRIVKGLNEGETAKVLSGVAV